MLPKTQALEQQQHYYQDCRLLLTTDLKPAKVYRMVLERRRNKDPGFTQQTFPSCRKALSGIRGPSGPVEQSIQLL